MGGEMGKKGFVVLLLALGIGCVVASSPAEAYTYKFLDDQLELRGRLEHTVFYRTHIPHDEKQFHDSNLGLNQSLAVGEVLYHWVDNPDVIVNFYGFFKYWYDSTQAIDEEYRRGIASFNREHHRRPTFRDDDPVLEAYLDIMKGPWQITKGKQLADWGETENKRTADKINPLDLRHTNPGLAPFDEIKIGIWMIRAFYQSDLPGDLVFETLFIPGDHRTLRIPTEGTNWSSYSTLFRWFQKRWREERLGRNLSNYEFGFRVRGFFQGVDWTLFWFDTVDDTPTITRFNAWSQYLGRKVLEDDEDEPRLPQNRRRPIVERWRAGTLDYKRTKYLGGTGQYYWDWAKAVIRGEWAYEIGRHFNLYSGGGVVERDTLGYGIAIDRPIFWHPLLKYTNFQKLNFTVQFFQDWILNHDHKLQISGRGPGDKSSTTATMMLRQSLLKQTVMAVFRTLYNFSGYGYQAVALSYAPGSHWRWEAGGIFFWSRHMSSTGAGETQQERNSYDKDLFYFKTRYEF
jgi:hypothetical protein